MSGTFEGIPLPEQRPANNESFDIHSSKVDAWIRDLPLASIGETSRRLFGALTQTNRTRITPSERFRFIEQLREPVEYVLKGLEKHYVGISLPLPEKNAKIALLTKSMLMELVTGYKHIIEEALNHPAVRINRHQMTTCLYRVQTYLNLLLLNTYQTYMLVPPAVWREIHLTFQRAEGLDVQDSTIEKSETERTISSTYRQALLLSLANPYSIGQKDLATLFTLLDKWSSICPLSKATGNEPADKTLSVNLGSSAPPSPVTHDALNAHADIRIIETHELTALVKAQQEQQAEDKQSLPLASDILDRIVAAWECRTKRGFSRSNKADEVLITIGLSAIYDFLSSPVSTPEALNSPEDENVAHERASFSAQRIVSLSHSDMPDVWDLHKRPHEVKVESRLTSEKPRYIAFSFQIVDESAGGYCLSQVSTEPPPQVRVGDLIMIFQNAADHNIESGLGIIRWIKNSRNLGFRIGVELVAPTATPVETALYSGAQGLKSSYLRALILPELTFINQPATLLTPTIYRSGTHLLLNLPTVKQHVKLTRRTEHTNCFSRFEFEVLKMLSDAAGGQNKFNLQSKSDKEDNPGEFDNIWSII